MTTVKIPQENLAKLKVDFAKLIKKAEKLGCQVPVLSVGEVSHRFTGLDPITGVEQYRTYVSITVDGSAPRLNDWVFIGVLEPFEGSVIIRSIPGKVVPESYRTADASHCDHCNTGRRRNSVFVVQNTVTGTYKQVGRSCLADFTGHASPEQLAAYATMLVTFDLEYYERDHEEGCGISHKHIRYSLRHAVKTAYTAIIKHGFYKSDSEYPTKNYVYDVFVDRETAESFVMLPEAEEKCDAAIEYMKAMTGNEFAMNTAIYAASESVPHNAFGYICAGVNKFIMATRTAVAESAKQVINNDPIAGVGEKVKLTCKVLSAVKFERNSYSYYDIGISQILMMQTADNKLVKMFTSNLDIAEGDTVLLSGKIKEQVKETFERSKFKGCMITSLAPRARITVQ